MRRLLEAYLLHLHHYQIRFSGREVYSLLTVESDRAADQNDLHVEVVIKSDQVGTLAYFKQSIITIKAGGAGGNRRRHARRIVERHAGARDVAQGFAHRDDRAGNRP